MKNAILIFTMLRIISTFIGAGCVLSDSGGGNAGYAVVPMAFSAAALAFIGAKNSALRNLAVAGSKVSGAVQTRAGFSEIAVWRTKAPRR